MKGIMISDNNELMIQPVSKDGLIVSGLTIGNIDYQRCRLIMETAKGEWKEYPTIGFNIERYLRSLTENKRQQFITELTKELKSDGLAPKITVGNDLSQLEILL